MIKVNRPNKNAESCRNSLQLSAQKLKALLSSLTAILVCSVGQAASIELSSPEERYKYLREADTWQKPSWINDDFSFDPTFSIRNLPLKKDEELLAKDQVACQMTQELATEYNGIGLTPKFKCLLLSFNKDSRTWELVRNKKGNPKKIKVKYDTTAGEAQGEVLASRLLWALGFGADRMFPVKKVLCFGCSKDPFRIRELDSSSNLIPQEFHWAAIEQKMDGEAIEISKSDLDKPGFLDTKAKPRKGWSYDEILSRNGYSRDLTRAREQIIERDALLTLGGFLRHTDNKSDNHRLICEGEVSSDGKCLGTTRIIMHDVGYTFGWGPSLVPVGSIKVDLKAWRRAKVFAIDFDKGSCTVNQSISFNMRKVVVTEEGRQLAAKLMSGFIAGDAGRKRVRDLFEFAAVEEAGRGEAGKWVETFIEKVAELNNPALSAEVQRSHYTVGRKRDETPAQFSCSKRADRVLKWISR